MSLWNDCMWEGAALDVAVAKLLGLPVDLAHFHPSLDWAAGGPLIESNQIFLDPPSTLHRNYGGKRPNEWVLIPMWRATVSAKVRTYPNAHIPEIGNVGRGEGPTPLIAAMRAIVASFGGAA